MPDDHDVSAADRQPKSTALTDEELAALIALKPAAVAKALVSDLLAAGSITHEQASFSVYLRPDMKHA